MYVIYGKASLKLEKFLYSKLFLLRNPFYRNRTLSKSRLRPQAVENENELLRIFRVRQLGELWNAIYAPRLFYSFFLRWGNYCSICLFFEFCTTLLLVFLFLFSHADSLLISYSVV